MRAKLTTKQSFLCGPELHDSSHYPIKHLRPLSTHGNNPTQRLCILSLHQRSLPNISRSTHPSQSLPPFYPSKKRPPLRLTYVTRKSNFLTHIPYRDSHHLMSLLNNPDGFAHGPISPGAGASAGGGGATQFLMQAALIPHKSKFEYQGARKLATIVEKTFDSGLADEYFLYFHGVTDGDFDAIERELRRVQLRTAVRLTFENTLNAAILRISSGPEHGRIGMSLYLEILVKISSIPGHSFQSVEGFGATLLQDPGVRSKQGDRGFGPATRVGRNVWPSVMIQVGYSAGEEFFHLDAAWWLINSADRIRFVILVCVAKDPLALGIECWSLVESGSPESGHNPRRVPTCVQKITIDTEGNVESMMGSTELRIPYDAIFDEVQENPPDIVFSFDDLKEFTLRRFRMIQP